jgi:hypothetical protein
MDPPPFPIPSTLGFPVFTDNVLPSMLVHLGVIDLSMVPTMAHAFPRKVPVETLLEATHEQPTAEESKEPPEEGPVLNTTEAYILRAAAIDASEKAVEMARSDVGGELFDKWVSEITLPSFDIWLWAIAKDRPDYRKLPRFVLRDTVFF